MDEKPKKKKKPAIPIYESMYPEQNTLQVLKRTRNGYIPVGEIDEVEKTLAGIDRSMVLYDQNKKSFVRKFDSPEILWDCAKGYFGFTNDTPWKKQEGVKSGLLAGQIMELDTAKPYTLAGLLVYLGITRGTYNKYKTDPNFEDFHEVIEFIELVVEDRNLTGAAVGAFNASVMGKVLGLVDRKEIDSKMQVTKFVAKVTIK